MQIKELLKQEDHIQLAFIQILYLLGGNLDQLRSEKKANMRTQLYLACCDQEIKEAAAELASKGYYVSLEGALIK